MKTRFAVVAMLALFCMFTAKPVLAADDAHTQKADEAIAKGVKAMKAAQLQDGSWLDFKRMSIAKPAVTALVLNALIRNGESVDDPKIKAGVDYMLKHQKPDGSFHAGALANYSTAMTLMTLGALPKSKEIDASIKKAHQWVIGNQWGAGKTDQSGKKVDEAHEFFGGFNYGKSNRDRPDLSNTATMMEALYDSGFDCESPTYQKAMEFIKSCQGIATNTKNGDKIEQDGGFVYDPTKPAKGGKLRAYGSMTYAGFKALLYGKLGKNDKNVQAALGFITNNYNLEENPGVGSAGYYYYLYVMSRALHTLGDKELTLADGTKVNWANDLIDQIVSLQKEDGTWVNSNGKWMESQSDLVTAYALLALHYAKMAK